MKNISVLKDIQQLLTPHRPPIDPYGPLYTLPKKFTAHNLFPHPIIVKKQQKIGFIKDIQLSMTPTPLPPDPHVPLCIFIHPLTLPYPLHLHFILYLNYIN